MNVGEVDVVVTGSRTRATNLPGSVDVIGEAQISKEVTTNALDVMRRIAGFAYQDYGNGGVPNGFMMRGFASNHGADTLVVIDGIPLNDHFWQEDGAPDLNQLTTEEIERIEVIKGPLDARYGNWARSGIIVIDTRTEGDFWRAKASRGSYGSNKGYVSFGSEHADGQFNQVYSIEYFQAEGWRANTEQQRQNAYGKWFYRPLEGLRVGAMVHAYQADWSTGSYISEDLWEENPRQAFPGSTFDGGKRKVLESSLHLDWELTKHLFVQSRLWRKKSVSSRYADWTYEGVGQSETHAKEWVSGGLLSVNSAWPLPMDQKLSVEGGADYRYYDSNVSNWVTEARVRQRINAMDHYDLHNGGLYAKVNHDIAHLVGLFGGVRQDAFWGKTRNRLTGGNNRMPEYFVTTYKAGTIVSPLSELNFYGNIGTTYRLPHGAEKYSAEDEDVTKLTFWELGAKSTPLDWLTMRYAFFRSSERLTRFVEGEYVDNGKARRMGHEFEVGVGPWHGVEVFTALTLHDAQYRGGENGGNNVTDVPRYIWKVGAQAESHWGTGARAFYNDVGRWDTDPENDHSYAGYRVVDAGVYQRIAEDWTAALDVKNLLDETYAEYVSYWSDANQYMSANPRTFFATLSYSVE